MGNPWGIQHKWPLKIEKFTINKPRRLGNGPVNFMEGPLKKIKICSPKKSKTIKITSFWKGKSSSKPPVWGSMLILHGVLVGAWTNPSEKNVLVKLDHPPNRGKNKTCIKTTTQYFSGSVEYKFLKIRVFSKKKQWNSWSKWIPIGYFKEKGPAGVSGHLGDCDVLPSKKATPYYYSMVGSTPDPGFQSIPGWPETLLGSGI